MIPKRLIYGNFGSMKLRPDVEELCMESWKTAFPKSEWEYVELNEKTFDIDRFGFTRSCYKNKQYSFVNDFARTYELVLNGGVYVDLDQLMFRPLDENMFNDKMFIGSCMHPAIDTTYGDITSQGLMGVERDNKLMTRLLDKLVALGETDAFKHDTKHVIVMDIMKDLLKNVEGVKRKDIKNMMAPIEYPDVTIYPFDYFTCTFWTTDFVEITDRSYGIQLYGASWRRDDKKAKIYERIQNIFKKF